MRSAVKFGAKIITCNWSKISSKTEGISRSTAEHKISKHKKRFLVLCTAKARNAYYPLDSFNLLIYQSWKHLQVLSVDHWLSGEYLPPFPVNIGESRSLVVAQIHFKPFHHPKWRQMSICRKMAMAMCQNGFLSKASKSCSSQAKCRAFFWFCSN